MMLGLNSLLDTYQPRLGRVERAITALQPGRIKYQATYWPAELEESFADISLQPNDWVEVLSRRGLVLIVRPYQP